MGQLMCNGFGITQLTDASVVDCEMKINVKLQFYYPYFNVTFIRTNN